MRRVIRSDLPPNRKLAEEIILLEKTYGKQEVKWDGRGRWVQINRFRLRSSHFEFNVNPIYILAFVPPGYGERRGDGAGIEEFYVPRDLRMRRPGGAWQTIPNTYKQYDRRGGRAVNMEHLYACVHLRSFDPRRHGIDTSLAALQMLLTDPEAFS